jgi:2-methylfumaryl-CoA hydratase
MPPDNGNYDGNFFEDFSLGREFCHLPGPVVGAADDVLVFNLVFGQSVRDISLNAVANLGYAEGRFGVPVQAGDTLESASKVIGLREVSAGDAGIVWVHTTGTNQRGGTVLDYKRWVLVKKRNRASPAPAPVVPQFVVPPAGGVLRRVDHGGGAIITEEEHQAATRSYGNPARVHFDPAASKYGCCLVYGGYVFALAHALMKNSFPQIKRLLALHGGAHPHPVFAGDALYAGSEVLEEGPGQMRLRLLAAKKPFASWPLPEERVLEMDCSFAT